MMPAISQLPWQRITHAVGYWALSLWLFLLSINFGDNLIDVYSGSEDLRRLNSPFTYYKVISWICMILTGVAVAAQARRLRRQHISPVALFAAAALPTIHLALVFRYFD